MSSSFDLAPFLVKTDPKAKTSKKLKIFIIAYLL